MPRIILKCPYIKGGEAAAHLNNLVKYIATREGVVKIKDSRRLLPATEKQKDRLEQIVNDFPDTKYLFEYEDYLKAPTVANASDFITIALEHNFFQISQRENYVDYIANRPRVQRMGSHGLFTGSDDTLVLSQVANAVANHPGNVWTPIISLRREDASRLGYDNAEDWKALLMSQAAEIADSFKIHLDHFQWYAAFHNESHHPHIHMICYSSDPKEGYLTRQGIAKMKSGLARDIFRQELIGIYAEQSQRRDALGQEALSVMEQLVQQMQSGVLHNEKIEQLTAHLAHRLQFISGKKQYGYLPAKLKSVVDEIVDELAKDSRVAEAYRLWYEMRNEVLRTYMDELPEPLPLSKQKEFKSVRNMVIREAVNISNQAFTFEEPAQADDPFPVEMQDESASSAVDPQTEEEPPDKASPYVEWSERYKQARQYLFGSDDFPQDFEQAYNLLLEEAQCGNALAMHDLGRIFADGLGRDADTVIAREWYAKTLAAFLAAEEEKPGRYLEYRIGKMYSAGLGTEQDHTEAAGWFESSAGQNYKYAQYALAGLYHQGKGVEQDQEKAFALYLKSSSQGFPYADFELGKMLRDGIGTEKNAAQSERHFRSAFSGFRSLEAQSHDDKLQYRLGWMLLNGVGTDKDIFAATRYFEKSAQLGNTYAGYQLAKLILADETASTDKVNEAVKWLSEAADSGNAYAQYALAKLYRDGTRVAKDTPKAVRLFTFAADQGNEYAAYQLGKLYLSGEGIPKDVSAALRWLMIAAEKGNEYAQYALGKLWLSGEDIPKDVPAALRWLTAAAEKGNQYAQYALGKLYLSGEDVLKDVPAALRWLTTAAERGNQYAQYTLGKLYLLGRDVAQDREAAIRWFTASATQGNIYAQFFIDNMDRFRNPSAFLAATRMLHHMSRIFRQNTSAGGSGGGLMIDRKRQRKLREKKAAQGHARDDHEQNQTMTM